MQFTFLALFVFLTVGHRVYGRFSFFLVIGLFAILISRCEFFSGASTAPPPSEGTSPAGGTTAAPPGTNPPSEFLGLAPPGGKFLCDKNLLLQIVFFCGCNAMQCDCIALLILLHFVNSYMYSMRTVQQ